MEFKAGKPHPKEYHGTPPTAKKLEDIKDNKEEIDIKSLKGEEREKFILKWTNFIRSMAYNIRNRLSLPINIDIQDLTQTGIIGLMYAMDGYDPTRGDFKTYAKIKINEAIFESLRSGNVYSKEVYGILKKVREVLVKNRDRNRTDEEMGKELNMSLENYRFYLTLANPRDINISIGDIPDIDTFLKNYESPPDQLAHENELREILNTSLEEFLAELPLEQRKRYRQIYEQYFIEEKTFNEIGEELSIGETYPRKILKRIQQGVENILKAKGIQPSDILWIRGRMREKERTKKRKKDYNPKNPLRNYRIKS